MTVLFCICDAPRDNPLDPWLGGNIDGRVMTRRADGIPYALVLIPGADRVTRTDSAGGFSFRGLPEQTLWVYLSADGYAPDSQLVQTDKGRIDSLTSYLNGLPYFTHCSISAHVYGRGWPPEPLLYCRLAAQVTDRDGDADIDSVWASIPDIGFTKRLIFDPDSGRYYYTLWASAIPSQRLETLVGLPVRITAADERDTVSRAPSPGITRIIYDLPQPLFPFGGLDTLSTDTTLIWQRFDHGYSVRYHGEVVRIEAGSPAGIVAAFDTPGPADTSYRIQAQALVTGDYYWTIEAVDIFGNSSRSAEELFHAR